MPIISTLERKTAKGRLGLGAVYLFLLIGAVTTLYPFLLMLRRTTVDEIDRDSLSPLPAYWWNRDQMARKYLVGQYALERTFLPWVYDAFGPVGPDGRQSFKWEYLGQADGRAANPEFRTDFWREAYGHLEAVPTEALAQRVADYHAFAAQADPWFLQAIFTYRPGRSFTNQWIQFHLAEKEGVSPKAYRHIESVRPQWNRRDWFPEFDDAIDKWQDWLRHGLQPAETFVYSAHDLWGMFLKRAYRDNLAALNEAHGADYRSFADGPAFTASPPPPGTRLRQDWEAFAVNAYPLLWQRLVPETAVACQADWRQWLADSKGVATPEDWNRFTGMDIDSSEAMALAAEMPRNDAAARWWCEFVHDRVPWNGRILRSPDADFQAFLAAKYASVAALNAAWGTGHADFASVRLPRVEADYLTVSGHAGGIRRELTVGNYRKVFTILAVEGNAVANTFVILILCLATGLTVNPLAAYALSRFRLKSTHQILIFLLATMALPAEIAMVPSFLLVRDLGLINTYFALVLPSAANAFSIFLLKGFFDSLPAELYEAAMLDGANEATLFLRITIPLSMPILAVKVLGITMAAYNMFMPVVIYITNQDLWPISTKIYEINQTAAGGAEGMTALVLASLFPLIVFIFCQRTIMRGIILPSFK